MIKEYLYTYLGTNGIITSPVLLEGIPNVKKVRIRPEIGGSITNGETTTQFEVIVSEEESEKWSDA